MAYLIISELCESRLIPTETSLKKWDQNKVRDVAYLYFLAMRILVAEDSTRTWAIHYNEKTAEENDFKQWRTDGNDFYVLLYALHQDQHHLSTSPIRDWLRHGNSRDFDEKTHKLFNRLDSLCHITDSTLKAMRRKISHWPTITNTRERRDLLDEVIHHLEKMADHSELLHHLRHVGHKDIKETASAGATSVASIATVAGGIGGGFNPADTWRSIYGNPKPKKKTSPAVIRRVMPSD